MPCPLRPVILEQLSGLDSLPSLCQMCIRDRYRCLLPQNTDNLLVAGRCISTTREMNGSTRVMPCCFITGMAAGTAGALAQDCSLRELSAEVLRNALREQGAYLPE